MEINICGWTHTQTDAQTHMKTNWLTWTHTHLLAFLTGDVSLYRCISAATCPSMGASLLVCPLPPHPTPIFPVSLGLCAALATHPCSGPHVALCLPALCLLVHLHSCAPSADCPCSYPHVALCPPLYWLAAPVLVCLCFMCPFGCPFLWLPSCCPTNWYTHPPTPQLKRNGKTSIKNATTICLP